MSEPLLRTPLYDWHAAHGARLVPFGGWEMPVQYSSIVEEHLATRTAAGLFDICHMGRINFAGPDAAAFLDRLLTNSVLTLKPGQIRYSLIVNEQGGILDDVLVYRTPAAGKTDHMLVVNASNRPKILRWIDQQLGGSRSVQVVDHTCDWGMIALQGPRSMEIVRQVVQPDPNPIAYYHFAGAQACGGWCLASRTGYTGEDGVELVVPAENVAGLWQSIHAAAEPLGLRPCGLGARDTLRLEAGMPLYGHELTEDTDPFMAGLEFAVKLDKPEFMGKSALVAAQRARLDGTRQRRVGLELQGRRIAREGFPVLRAGAKVGTVTSGTFAPTLGKSIAMAYVQPDAAALGAELEVDVRGQAVAAKVVKLPFYKRAK